MSLVETLDRIQGWLSLPRRSSCYGRNHFSPSFLSSTHALPSPLAVPIPRLSISLSSQASASITHSCGVLCTSTEQRSYGATLEGLRASSDIRNTLAIIRPSDLTSFTRLRIHLRLLYIIIYIYIYVVLLTNAFASSLAYHFKTILRKIKNNDIEEFPFSTFYLVSSFFSVQLSNFPIILVLVTCIINPLPVTVKIDFPPDTFHFAPFVA